MRCPDFFLLFSPKFSLRMRHALKQSPRGRRHVRGGTPIPGGLTGARKSATVHGRQSGARRRLSCCHAGVKRAKQGERPMEAIARQNEDEKRSYFRSGAWGIASRHQPAHTLL